MVNQMHTARNIEAIAQGTLCDCFDCDCLLLLSHSGNFYRRRRVIVVALASVVLCSMAQTRCALLVPTNAGRITVHGRLWLFTLTSDKARRVQRKLAKAVENKG